MSDDLAPPAPARTLEQLAAELDEAKAFASRLLERLKELERASGLYATNKDLDGPSGDPTVRFSVDAWRGDPMVGRRFSQCHPAFLDLLAASLQWSADNPKPDKLQYVKGNRLDAKRARSWARRLRAAGAGPVSTETPAAASSARPTRTRATRARTPRGARETASPDPTPEKDDDFSPPT